MSFRTRLFLLLSCVIALLLAGQWWLTRTLTRELGVEVGEVAASVGQAVVTAITTGPAPVVLRGEGAGSTDDEPAEPGLESSPKAIQLHLSGPGPATATANGYAFELNGKRLEVRDGEGHLMRSETIGEPGAHSTDTETLEHDGRHIVVRVQHGEGEPNLVIEEPQRARLLRIPQTGIDERLASFRRRLLAGTFLLAGVGLAAVAVVAHRAAAPLARLSEAASRVGAGELGVQVGEPRERDLAVTVRAFNRMSADLKRLDETAAALRAREHLAELGEVSRGLAHSLRNPLHALGLSLEELALRAERAEEDLSEGDTAALATSARKQIERIDRAVRSLLVLAAEGERGAASEDVDLKSLVEDVVLEALQDAAGRVRITVDAPGDRGPRVRGVAAELRAAVQALVVNAVEASPAKGEVCVTLESRADRTVVRIEDRGPGLAAAVRERLFSPHVTTKPEGSGMGLFLAQRIASSRYGGTVTIEDRDGGGTRAELLLGDRRELEPNGNGG